MDRLEQIFDLEEEKSQFYELIDNALSEYKYMVDFYNVCIDEINKKIIVLSNQQER